MRTLTLKYDGECRKCSAELKAGQQGFYEKRVGVFCVPCAPSDPEEIRSYRQEAANRRADKLDEWAGKRRERAAAVFESNRTFTSDIAFNTQPGHIPLRTRIIRQEDRQRESLQKAGEMSSKAERLRNVRVAGDAERERQAKREEAETQFSKGDRIFCHMWGAGEIVGVYKKSFRVAFDRGYTHSIDKSWALPV